MIFDESRRDGRGVGCRLDLVFGVRDIPLGAAATDHCRHLTMRLRSSVAGKGEMFGGCQDFGVRHAAVAAVIGRLDFSFMT